MVVNLLLTGIEHWFFLPLAILFVYYMGVFLFVFSMLVGSCITDLHEFRKNVQANLALRHTGSHIPTLNRILIVLITIQKL